MRSREFSEAIELEEQQLTNEERNGQTNGNFEFIGI